MSRSLELCHIYGLFKLTSSSILRGERYFNRDWFLFTSGFVAHSVCGNVLDRFVLRENIYLTRICCDLSHLELCRVHWNCVTSTDDSSLRLVQFFSENDILTEIGLIYVWICCSFSCLGTFWIVLFSGRTLVYACNFRVI